MYFSFCHPFAEGRNRAQSCESDSFMHELSTTISWYSRIKNQVKYFQLFNKVALRMKKPTCRPGPRRSSYKTVLKYNQLLYFIRKSVSILRGDSGTHSCPRLGPRDMQVMSSAVGPAGQRPRTWSAYPSALVKGQLFVPLSTSQNTHQFPNKVPELLVFQDSFL